MSVTIVAPTPAVHVSAAVLGMRPRSAALAAMPKFRRVAVTPCGDDVLTEFEAA